MLTVQNFVGDDVSFMIAPIHGTSVAAMQVTPNIYSSRDSIILHRSSNRGVMLLS